MVNRSFWAAGSWAAGALLVLGYGFMGWVPAAKAAPQLGWAKAVRAGLEGGAADLTARCRIVDRGRIHGAHGWRSPAAAPGLLPFAYWINRAGRGTFLGGLLPDRGGPSGKTLARGTFAEV